MSAHSGRNDNAARPLSIHHLGAHLAGLGYGTADDRLRNGFHSWSYIHPNNPAVLAQGIFGAAQPERMQEDLRTAGLLILPEDLLIIGSGKQNCIQCGMSVERFPVEIALNRLVIDGMVTLQAVQSTDGSGRMSFRIDDDPG